MKTRVFEALKLLTKFTVGTSGEKRTKFNVAFTQLQIFLGRNIYIIKLDKIHRIKHNNYLKSKRIRNNHLITLCS
jgi:hypothetical protein